LTAFFAPLAGLAFFAARFTAFRGAGALPAPSDVLAGGAGGATGVGVPIVLPVFSVDSVNRSLSC
jgi:hypothetical protein